DPLESYTIEIWESDAGEVLFGADDYIGDHPMNLNGCVGCAAGSSVIDYSISHQVIYPSATVISEDTVHIYDYPVIPPISFDSLSHTLSANDFGDNYQWYLNGSPILGATNTNFIIDSSGYYSIIAINAGGCVATSDSIMGVYCSPTYQPIISLNQDDHLEVTNPMSGMIQWFQDGGVLIGDTASVFIPSNTGSYTVVVTDMFGCSYESNPLSVTLGLFDSHSINDWSIFPNPATNSAIIEIQGNGTIEMLEVIDLTGRTLLTRNNLGSSTVLDLDSLNNGAYIIRLGSKGMYWTKTLIVQK
ncbi:MAG: T9SS type A sorting domain-containing protein, partial [Crocinitomicaceae bacterium]|nr:T9SS type A sorting domain-containing protein [Crocinitomicaceae bacterium]